MINKILKHNTKRLFWRIWYCNPAWVRGKLFAIHNEDDQISGKLYKGVTLFGHSLIYSDTW